MHIRSILIGIGVGIASQYIFPKLQWWAVLLLFWVVFPSVTLAFATIEAWVKRVNSAVEKVEAADYCAGAGTSCPADSVRAFARSARDDN